jgi:hypothetical protein
MTDPTPNPDAPALVRIRNVSPRAALEVPLLRGRIVKRGEIIEVSPEHATRLIRQAIWLRVEEPARGSKNVNKPELLAHAASLGIDVPEDATKAAIATLINEYMDEHTTTPAAGNEGE